MVKNSKLFIAAWNVLTLLDIGQNNIPQRRTALVSLELQKYNVDIAALSETRLSEEGSVKEKDYTFFWKGVQQGVPRVHGVGFAIKNSLVSSLTELPVGISERIMTLNMKLTNSQKITLISVYAPTMTANINVIENFYQELDNVLSGIPRSNRVILLGDFNARVGKDFELWPSVLGRNGIGKTNSNGLRLLDLCTTHGLTITNTMFRQKDKYKTSWKHPRSGHWHLIDYVIVRNRDVKEVCITRAMRGAECWTDHRMIRSKLKLRDRPKFFKRPRIQNETIYFESLAHDLTKQTDFRQQIIDMFTDGREEQTGIEEDWNFFKNTLNTVGKNVCGVKTKRTKDWFSENEREIMPLIEEKRKMFQKTLNDPSNRDFMNEYKNIKREVQLTTRRLKNEWWKAKSDEINNLSNMTNKKVFFDSLKITYGPRKSISCPIKSGGGIILKNMEDIKSRWKEHYELLLNVESQIDVAEISNLIPDYITNFELDTVPTLEETKTAINLMKDNKATGLDNIANEAYKYGGDIVVTKIHDIITKIWNAEKVPKDFKESVIVSLYKGKGERSECGNYRGLSLQCTAGKIFGKILSIRLRSHIEQFLPESQAAFRTNRGTSDMLFCMRQIIEKCSEQSQELYIMFIDIVKAYDSVDRNLLWLFLNKFGCPPKFLNLLIELHSENVSRVRVQNDTTDAFQIKNGVKQGCVLAPFLFNIFMTGFLIIIDSRLQSRGIGVNYRFDGGLNNTKRLKSKTLTLKKYVSELQYADDCAILAHSANELQDMIQVFSEVYTLLGLKINTQKSKILMHNKQIIDEGNIDVMLGVETIENVERFKYLGGYLTNDGSLDIELQQRLQNACISINKLNKRVYKNKDITENVKCQVFKSITLPTLLYGCESWVLYRKQIKQLENFQQRFLRNTFKIKWHEHVSNATVLERAKCKPIEELISQAQMRWVGHTVRMKENRLPKVLLYSELERGFRHRGCPKKRFKDCIKVMADNLEVGQNWEELAQDRNAWKQIVNSVDITQKNLRQQAAANRQLSVCNVCMKVCGSRIGLFSHSRTHFV